VVDPVPDRPPFPLCLQMRCTFYEMCFVSFCLLLCPDLATQFFAPLRKSRWWWLERRRRSGQAKVYEMHFHVRQLQRGLGSLWRDPAAGPWFFLSSSLSGDACRCWRSVVFLLRFFPRFSPRAD